MAFTLQMDKILDYLRPGEFYTIQVDPFDYARLEWTDPVTSIPSEQDMLDAELAAAKADMVLQVKKEAGIRIFAAVPQWRQNNIGRGIYTAETTPTLASLNTLIDDIRTESDTAETDVDALETIAEVLAFTW